MSHTDDTQPNRGRPVLRMLEPNEDIGDAEEGKLWVFCGEYEGREPDAVDAAHAEHGGGIYQAFAAGSWGRGYWRG